MTGFRRIGEREVHQGYVWRVVVAEFESPEGERFHRDIVRSPGAVAVVPLIFDPEGNASVLLVEQYRPPYERTIIEIPAGMRDVDDEPPEVTAHRELIEEAGMEAGRLDHLVDILPSPGLTDSVTIIFLATECSPVERDLHGPEEQHMTLLHLPLGRRAGDDRQRRDRTTPRPSSGCWRRSAGSNVTIGGVNGALDGRLSGA